MIKVFIEKLKVTKLVLMYSSIFKKLIPIFYMNVFTLYFNTFKKGIIYKLKAEI